MKNIERKEVQELLCEYLVTGTFRTHDFERLGYEHGRSSSELGSWLKAEYNPPKKYYWHLKGFGYLNLNSYLKDENLTVDSNAHYENIETRFTEQEYRELSERFGFDFNMFEREDVD